MSPSESTKDPCNFSDRYGLIDRIDSNRSEYNISLLINTCEGVCPLVYGSGNPDISGAGVKSLASLTKDQQVDICNTPGHDFLYYPSSCDFNFWSYASVVLHH